MPALAVSTVPTFAAPRLRSGISLSGHWSAPRVPRRGSSRVVPPRRWLLAAAVGLGLCARPGPSEGGVARRRIVLRATADQRQRRQPRAAEGDRSRSDERRSRGRRETFDQADKQGPGRRFSRGGGDTAEGGRRGQRPGQSQDRSQGKGQGKSQAKAQERDRGQSRDSARNQGRGGQPEAAGTPATSLTSTSDEPEEAWREGDPVEVIFDRVSWSPAVAGAGEAGRFAIKEVLQFVSWCVRTFDRVGLIGANGCGKSSALLMIQGLLQPTGGNIVKRPPNMRIAYMQQEADLDSEKTAFEELCSAFNDRPLSAIDHDLERCAAAPDADLARMSELLEERTQADAHLEQVEALIPKLGLEVLRNTRIPDLSGGWQMRVALGKIILSRPDLILLDEPTNHVDLETIEFMEDFLRVQDVAMVIVSHDRYFLNRVCNRIVEISRGRARSYEGDYITYLRAKDLTLAQAWRTYQKYQERVKLLEHQIRRLQERFIVEKAAQKREQLQFITENPVPKPEVLEIREFRFPSSLTASATGGTNMEDGAGNEWNVDEGPKWEQNNFDGDDDDHDHDGDAVADGCTLLAVTDLNVAYADQVVLDGITFAVKRGEKVALVGRNGCGKSTLVRAIVGDLESSAEVQGTLALTSRGTAYFPQRLAEAMNYDHSSVKDALYMSCGVADIETAGGMEAVLQRLRLDGVTKDQPVSSLSGGEKARVAFAQFLLQPFALLVLDEPTNHLDIPTRELLEDALKAFDGAALVVSHDRYFLREFATRVIEVMDGGLRDYQSWEAYTSAAPPQWQAAAEAEVAFIEQDGKAALIWSRKKLARLKKQEGNIGLRRLSPRAREFMPEEKEHLSRAEQAARQLLDQYIAEGVDPSLLGPHAPAFDEDEGA